MLFAGSVGGRDPLVIPPNPTEVRMLLFSCPSLLVEGAMVHERSSRSSILANGPEEDEDEDDANEDEDEDEADSVWPAARAGSRTRDTG